MSIFSRHIEQRRVSLLAQTLLDLRIHGDDAISMALHIRRDAMAGAQRIAGKADHRDRFRALKQVGDGIGLR